MIKIILKKQANKPNSVPLKKGSYHLSRSKIALRINLPTL
jgi:hypothetical protein